MTAEGRQHEVPFSNTMARRRLGQHDLADDEIAALIVRDIEISSPLGGSSVLEIGAGNGRLTGAVLDREPRSVTAIEIDPERVEKLLRSFPGSIDSGRLRIVPGDARDAKLLALELDRLPAPRRVFGSLPYYAATVILDRLLDLRKLTADLHLVVQQEVASRLAALPGTPDYGFLSVLTQARASVSLVRHLPPSCFRPIPKVDSALVSLRPKAEPLPEGFRRYLSAAFRHRRKMLKNNLKGFTDQRHLEEVFLSLGIPISERPGSISVLSHGRLCSHLAGTGLLGDNVEND